MTIIYYIIAAAAGAILALGCYIIVKKIMLNGKKEEILEKAELEAEKIKQEKIFLLISGKPQGAEAPLR